MKSIYDKIHFSVISVETETPFLFYCWCFVPSKWTLIRFPLHGAKKYKYENYSTGVSVSSPKNGPAFWRLINNSQLWKNMLKYDFLKKKALLRFLGRDCLCVIWFIYFIQPIQTWLCFHGGPFKCSKTERGKPVLYGNTSAWVSMHDRGYVHLWWVEMKIIGKKHFPASSILMCQYST